MNLFNSHISIITQGVDKVHKKGGENIIIVSRVI